MENLIATPKHWGKYKKYNVEEYGYKTILITGPIMGEETLKFGRLIQVRKKTGAFGSDTVLLRKSDGFIGSYHNMGFMPVADEYKEMFEKAMEYSDSLEYDNIEDEYTIMGKEPATGFVCEGLENTGDDETQCFGITITTEN